MKLVCKGAYYYYVTEKGQTYEETLLAVDKYAKDSNIPYRCFAVILYSYFLDLHLKINWNS